MKRVLIFLPIALTVLAVRSCHKSAPTPPVPPHTGTTPPIHVLPPPAPLPPPIPPQADDDAAGEPLSGLSSRNPHERLQVVRQAQDKWGSSKVAKEVDRHAIVGRWNNPTTSSAYFVFNADGTFKNVGLLKDTQGTYRFLSNGEIEFTYPGIIYGTNVQQHEYRLLTDTLELKFLGTWIRYYRATP